MSYAALVAALTKPAVTVKRHRVATSRSLHDEYLSQLAPGDWIDCRGITFAGEIVYAKRPSAYTKISYDANCRFTGNKAGSRLPAIYIAECAYMQFQFDPACKINNPGGPGILVYGLAHGAIDGFVIDNCATDGIDLFPVKTDIVSSLIRGEVHNIALDPSLDPHTEKGTGLHCCNSADTSTSYVLHDNDIAIYGHDCKYGGSVIEHGNPQTANQPHGNRLYVKAHAMLQQAVSQVAGNGLNLWGHISSADIKVVEADNLAGRAVSVDAYGTWAGVTVESGTAYGTRLAPWQKAGGVIYRNVTPAP